jgi:hypothetical protein
MATRGRSPFFSSCMRRATVVSSTYCRNVSSMAMVKRDQAAASCRSSSGACAGRLPWQCRRHRAGIRGFPPDDRLCGCRNCNTRPLHAGSCRTGRRSCRPRSRSRRGQLRARRQADIGMSCRLFTPYATGTVAWLRGEASTRSMVRNHCSARLVLLSGSPTIPYAAVIRDDHRKFNRSRARPV